MSNSSICTIDWTLSGATTPSQNVPWCGGYEEVFCIPQSTSIFGTLLSDCLISYAENSLGHGFTPLQRSSQCIILVQLTGLSCLLYAKLLIGLVGRVFANGPGDLSSIPGHVLPKTLKIVLDTSLLNTQHYKVHVKGKVEQSRERSSSSPLHLSVVAIEKGVFWSPATTVANFTFYLYMVQKCIFIIILTSKHFILAYNTNVLRASISNVVHWEHYLKNIYLRRRPHSVMAKVLDCSLKVS